MTERCDCCLRSVILFAALFDILFFIYYVEWRIFLELSCKRGCDQEKIIFLIAIAALKLLQCLLMVEVCNIHKIIFIEDIRDINSFFY